ncbi:hypothetical protein [Methylobacterium soli]|uniref:Uncharacterized protein n=1 Tax=Methylobacterium soli TaxID=553447 RepID=A0A6L3SRV1_9HYPH|nr:hypothetical protein [Methylobacterium soli]KAB1070362.1 hypothetical protein F6X53_30155 [Methylobacterium soli]GJE41251.1 hypothetical protein AEGHOMDF_0413 [Methylobacterium soli]
MNAPRDHAYDHLVSMLSRLKLTAIRDQLDSLVDEAARGELSSDIRNWTLGVTEIWTPFDVRLLMGQA